MGDHRQDGADRSQRQHHGDAIAAEAGGQLLDNGFGSRALATVPTCALKRAFGLHMSWQRLSSEQHSEQIGCRIGRAPGHVLRLERMLADRTGDVRQVLPALARLAGEVEPALGAPGDQRRGDRAVTSVM
jgi:hypothetical protein